MSTEQNTERVQTNGHDHGGTNGKTLRPSPAYQWLPAADLPDHLSGAVIPSAGVDTSEVWEKGQTLAPDAARVAFEQARVMAELQEEYSADIESALSPEDLAKDDAARRKIRDARRERETARELDEVKAETARARHEQKLREARQRQAEELATMQLAVVRETNPALGLSRLNLARRLSPAIALLPAVFATVAEGVNVGTAMHDISPETAVINWSLGPLFTLPLVAIMVAQFLGAVPMLGRPAKGEKVNEFIKIEVVLFLAAVVMNVGPHVLDGDLKGAIPWLSVPAGFALSMYLLPLLRNRLNAQFVEAAEGAKEWLESVSGKGSSEVRPTPSDLHGENPGEGSGANPGEGVGERSGEVVPDPDRESLDSIRERLRALAAAGEVDPHRVSVNAARKALGVRPERAEEALIAEYGRPDLVERRRRREEKKKRS